MKKLALLLLIRVVVAQDFVPNFSSQSGNHLSPNVVAFWKFDEHTGDAVDASGNGKTLTQNGSVSDGAGNAVVGSSRAFSAVNDTDSFTRTHDSAFNFGTNAFTLTCWAYFDSGGGSVTGDMSLISNGSYNLNTMSWWLALDHGTPDSLRFQFSTNGVYNFTDAAVFTFDGGVVGSGWYFIVARWNGSTIHLSATDIGASMLASDGTAAFSGSFYANTTDNIYVGDIDNIHDLGGGLDEMGIWSRYLSDCEVAKLFTAKGGILSFGGFDSNVCQ